jgi:hypothetical protein
MKQFPEVESEFSSIIDIFYSAVSSKLLTTAVDLEVFNHLEEPAPPTKVSDSLSLNPENTIHMLDALCALNLVKKESNVYQNQKKASEFLVKGKPTYIGEWMLITDKDVKPCLDNFSELIRSGPQAVTAPDDMNSEECCEKFTASHAASSFAGIANDIAKSVSMIPSFKNCEKMLDMGGGPGVNVMAVVSKNENLEAMLFDRPEIVRMAENYIKEYGFSDRIKTIGGDYLKDDIGSDYDMIMITDSLYYSDEEIDAVLNKCKKCLKSDGFFVGIHGVFTDERTQPADMVMGMLPEIVMNSGFLPDKGFLFKALERCGFHNVSSKMVSIGGGMMEMNVGYLK